MGNELDIMNSNVPATNSPSFSLKDLNLNKAYPSVVVASTGAKISNYPFPKLKFTEGERKRVAIITDEVIIVRTHYHDDIGSIICNGGACCKYCDRVAVRYIYPCVVYDTDKAGRPISQGVEIKVLVLGGEMYDQISLLSELNGGSITNTDLLFTCTESKFQKCQVTQAGQALWKNDQDIVNHVRDHLANNGGRILEGIGKIYTKEEIEAKLAVNAPAPEQKVITQSDINNIYKL